MDALILQILSVSRGLYMIKICTKCLLEKNILYDYYVNQGCMRSECKACTIKRNSTRQKLSQPWKNRFADEETRKAYAREYYNKNKEKFANYRAEFIKRNPDYYKMYFRDKKNEKNEVRGSETLPQ